MNKQTLVNIKTDIIKSLDDSNINLLEAITKLNEVQSKLNSTMTEEFAIIKTDELKYYSHEDFILKGTENENCKRKIKS